MSNAEIEALVENDESKLQEDSRVSAKQHEKCNGGVDASMSCERYSAAGDKHPEGFNPDAIVMEQKLTANHGGGQCRGPPSTRFKAWNDFTERNRYFILAFWILFVCPLGFHCSPLFLASTQNLQDLRSNRNLQEQEAHMPTLSLYALIEQDDATATGTLVDGESELYHSIRLFVSTLAVSLHDLAKKETGSNGHSVNITSYYSLEQQGLKKLAQHEMSTSNGRATILHIFFTDSKAQILHRAIKFVLEQAPPGVSISFTSFNLLEEDVRNSIQRDAAFIHKVIAPIAMIILVLLLGNIPIVITPILTIVTTILGGGVVMYPWSLLQPVSQFTPLLMVIMAVGLSVDYCLFLTTRCTEDIASGMTKKDAIASMVGHSGHTILVSGCILCGSCLGLLTIPVKVIANVGIGLSATIIVALLVNISLVPALFHTPFGDFLLRPMDAFRALSSNEKPVLEQRVLTANKHQNHFYPRSEDVEVGLHDDTKGTDTYSNDQEQIECMHKSLWYRLGKVLIDPSKGSLLFLMIVALIVPVARFIPQTAYSMATDLQIPSNSQSGHTLKAIRERFGYGMVYDTRIEFDGTFSGTRIDTEDSFAVMKTVLNELTGEQFPATPTTASYAGLTTLGGIEVPFSFYEEALRCGPDCSDEAAKTIAVLATNNFNIDSFYTKAFVKMNVDPLSSAGIDWLIKARQKVADLSTNGALHNLRVWFKGTPEMFDIVESVKNSFHKMIGVTLVIVYILMALCYHSVMLPFLSILSISLTQGFVYGLAVLIYQHGALNKLGIQSLSSSCEIHWAPPIITFMIIVGLGLDYDIFLINRVLEYINEGYTLQSSVLMGLYKTRRVISAAGMIMAVAMGGLLNSEIKLLGQISFLWASAILVDAFVVRTVVLPILLCRFGELAWWPMKFPEATKDIIVLTS